jgi:hypothetical protein
MLGTLGVFCSRETLDVTIQDTTPPALSVPPTVVVGTSSDGGADCQVAVAVTAEAWDTCAEGDVTITNDRTAGGAEYREELPVGTHEVTFTATDPSGNAAVETTTIQVVDDTPPTILLAAVSPAELWPPSHRMREVTVTLEVADNCDAAPRVTLVAVRSSEPADATGEGDGHTAVDVAGAELGTDDRHVLLRAERAGGGPGRTYALEYVVSDSAGNATPLTLAVVVPHDRSDGVRARAERMLPVRGAGTRPRR